ncbi:MAG: TetR/AcrR family transcriptional regulator [Polyangiaceae bacterium]
MTRSAPSAVARARKVRRDPAAPAKAPRRRRDAAVARADILDAAARRLVLSGSSGIRLQEVAAEAGVSHPTVLHHFGSRELLVEAVIARALEGIHQSLVSAIQAASALEERHLQAMIDAVADALGRGGHGRVILWLALEGHPISAGAGLSSVVEAAHAVRKASCKGAAAPREDTARVVVLAALTLVASSVLGPTIFSNVGLGGDEAAMARFRGWLTRVLWTHLDDAAPAAP